MFGLIVAGRPVQTDYVRVADQKFTFTIHDASKVKHLCLFLALPLQEAEAVVTVHYQWPDKPFVFLGHLSNTKPSAIYRLSSSSSSSPTVHATIGLSIEHQSVLTPGLGLVQTKRQIQMATRLLQHWFDFVRSFEQGGFVPVSVVNDWFEKVKRRVEVDEGYLED